MPATQEQKDAFVIDKVNPITGSAKVEIVDNTFSVVTPLEEVAPYVVKRTVKKLTYSEEEQFFDLVARINPPVAPSGN
jgi:hypothetical protein